MKESYLFDMNFNNVVFARRNKSYGAYQLRRDYSKRILAAAIVATSLFGIGVASPLLVPKPQIENVDKKDDGIKIIPIDERILLPPPKPEEPKAAAQPIPVRDTQVKTVRNPTPKVVPDSQNTPDEVPPTQKEMAGAIIGTQNKDGEMATAIDLSGLDGNTTGTGGTTDGTASVIDFAEEMPSFGGGDAALMSYISKKMRYPRQAVEERIEGTVIVSFVVNRFGKVTDVAVLKGLGYGTDEEATRVIRNMPDWSPGRQNGKPVAVRYTLPIRFNLQR